MRAAGPILAACVAAAMAPAACSGGDDAAPTPTVAAEERFAGSLTPPPPAGEDATVIATVGSSTIYAADVARHAAAQSLDTKAALDELIAIELLAQEALRRGLADDPEVVEVRKRERARRLVDLEFAAEFDGPEDVPDFEVDRTWNHPSVQAYYNHERYHDVVFVRIPFSTKKAKEQPDEEARLRAAAEAIYEAATAAEPPTSEEFVAIAQAKAAELGLRVETQRFATTRHRSAVEEFAAAAWSIDEHGEIAKPARTEWGWDVIYLDKVIPARSTTRAEAEPEIRRKRFEPAQKEAFAKWVESLVAASRIRRNDGQLELVEVSTTVVGP